MIDFLESRRIDINYQYFGGDPFSLMQKAGKSVADQIRKEYGSGIRVLAVCGTGNNAGDGIVAATNLSMECNVAVCLVKGSESLKTTESRRAFLQYRGNFIEFTRIKDEISTYDVIVDALLGYGMSGTPKGEVAEAIRIINESGKRVVSVDIPSGLGTELSVKPEMTITFFDVKKGMDSSNSGKIVVDNLGVGEEFLRKSGPGDFLYLKLPDPESHKGMNGRVAMVAGHTYYGSAVIAAFGSIRTGSDLVKVFTSAANVQKISSYDPQIIATVLNENSLQQIENSDSALIGPGNGDADVLEALKPLRRWPKTLVLDAEAISDFKAYRDLAPGSVIIATPHKGEFKRASGMDPSESAAREFAKKSGMIILLKGKQDIITDGVRTFVCDGGNARMSMGGTGDLLAGEVASIVNKTNDPLRAGSIAAFVNKRSGELAYTDKLFWYDVMDMIGKIPEVFRLIRKYNIAKV
ncbi:MAG: NAD(P)H-hydrate dehydratase [Thermoplasmataceae archaeon]